MAANLKKNLIFRPPVVAVMGHIDHGKTTLLDYIRKSNVVGKESGGITQHVGAYEVVLPLEAEPSRGQAERSGDVLLCQSADQDTRARTITFIDTPGHEAFSAIRSRSAKVADIVLLVIAADEGVKPQTKEAIKHIKESGAEPIAVINKIDKPEADAEKVKRELAKEDIVVESMAGKVPAVEVSATTGKGVSDLLEMIIMLAEVCELKADYSKPGQGVVVESFLDPQRGITATLLVRDGIVKTGDIIASESSFGKIKNLLNFKGEPIDSALPSMPVIVFGLEGAPIVGEQFRVFDNLEKAKEAMVAKEKKQAPAVAQEGIKAIKIVLKADFLGSLEAIEAVLSKLPQDKICLSLLKSEVGEVSESDVRLAKENEAIILAFRVKANQTAKVLAEREKIRINQHEIIYELIEHIRKMMEKALEPEIVRVDLGKMKVLEVFLNDKNRQIIGGKVIEGEVKRGASVEVVRDEQIIGQGKLINLQQDKKNSDRVGKGNECGLLYEGNAKAESGDVLVFYTQEKRKIDL